ncbi:MAG: TPM domain-containing protein [Pseudomonadota bacterium]|nr:TPM domain-containing protein [Pseudomonadota bacterium]
MFLLLLPFAWALDIPTPTAEQRVYKVPARWTMPVRAVTEAAGRTERKVWVVAYEKVIDGAIAPGLASETEDAIEQVWANWEAGADGVFSPQLDALVLLGMDDREVRVRMGSEWDARLGLHNDRLLPLIDNHFLPRAAASDYDGGLAALVTAVDRAVGDGLAEIAEREAGAKAVAEAAERRAEAVAREAEAARARVEQDRVAGEQRAAQLRAAAPWGGAGLLVVALGAAAAVRRRRAGAARASFRAGVAARRERLEAADTAFASFRVDTELRDRIVELRLKGPVTLAAFKEVSALLDRIQVGLAALRDRLDTLERGVVEGPLAAAPWVAAEAELDAPFAVETGTIQHRLFARPSETVEVAPLPFMDALEADYADARAGWERLLDAVDASLRRATDDLTAEPLEAHRAALDAAGLPRAWADAHPLAAAAEGAWAELEGLRAADPVAYLDALDAALAGAARAAAVVTTVLTGKAEAATARARALGVPDTADTVVDLPDRDPALARTQAEALHAALDQRLHSRGGAEVEGATLDAELGFDEVVAAWDELATRKSSLARTVATVGGGMAAAEKRVAELHARFAATRTATQRLAGEHASHTMGGVWREIGETAADLAQADAALASARDALTTRRHVAAEEAVTRAAVEHGEALQNLEQLAAFMAQLVAAKADVLRQLTTLDAARAGFAAELGGYGAFGNLHLLGAGDQLVAALLDEPTAGAVDWPARQDRLRAVLGAWSDAVRSAAVAWRAEQAHLRRIREEEERQRRLAQEAEQRRQRAARAQATAAAFGAYRTSSSSSSRPSARSAGSSFGGGRSAGSSFGGGGGRSGGSGFGGGGGRSGGRKF